MKNNYFILSLLFASMVYSCSSSSSEEVLTAEINYPVSETIKSIPLPPEGKRWIVNEKFSDEFNDGKLDDTKWFSTHPTWIGRSPGLFMKSQISFKDGMMMLKGGAMKDTTIHAYGKDITFNVKCAAVVSKTEDVHYGYYECRFKANKTTLSSTFWLSTRQNYSTEGRQPENAQQGRFGQELDICECIGRPGDFQGSDFCKAMHSNVHYWFTPTGGTNQDNRAEESVKAPQNGKLPSDEFNTYGCWWKDASNASFYLNDELSKNITFQNRKTKEPFLFTEPMGMNMVVETYPQPWVSLPTNEELNDDTKNTTYYDWVRAYTLMDMGEKAEGVDNSKRFENHINFISKPSLILAKGNKLVFSTAYTSGKDCTIYLVIHDNKNKAVFTKQQKIYSGYGNINFTLDNTLQLNKEHIAVAYLCDNNNVSESKYIEGDSFKFMVK